MTTKVGLYVRISEDAEGLGLGIARQEEDGRVVAAQRGWEIARIYADNDLSAYKVGVVRPDFEALLEDFAAGRIDGIVAYDVDRFVRQPMDLERAIALYDRRPGSVFATVQGDIDLSTSDGRTFARMLVAMGNKSSMDTSRRVKRKHLDLARRGLPVGGNRPFGWAEDGLTIKPEEAELIRRAAVDVLAGASLHGICRQWNEMGVTTPTRRIRKPNRIPLVAGGNPWRSTPLKSVLLNPRLAGWRSYHGEIATGFAGELMRGQQEPILTDDQWRAVVAVLTDPSRGGVHAHPGARKYLLSGIVRCASCSSMLRGNNQQKKNTFGYGCPARTNGGCGKVGVSGPQLDAHVTVLVLDHLAERNLHHAPSPWPRVQELEAVRGQLAELSHGYSTRQISARIFMPLVADLERQENDLLDEQSGWMRQQIKVTNASTDVVSEWETMSLDRRREIVGSVLQAVLVRPAVARGGRFDSSRAEPVWWQTDEPPAPIVHP